MCGRITFQIIEITIYVWSQYIHLIVAIGVINVNPKRFFVCFVVVQVARVATHIIADSQYNVVRRRASGTFPK